MNDLLNSKNKFKLKATAILLIISQLLTPSASANISVPLSFLPQNKDLHFSALGNRAFSIPESLGTVEENFYGKRNEFVVYIQDAHANYSAQKNIAGIIQYLSDKYDMNLVTVEAAEGEVDTGIFRAFPAPDITEKILDRRMQKGEIAGPQFAASTSKQVLQLSGIDQHALYTKNLAELLAVVKLGERQNAESILRRTRTYLKNITDGCYSDELKNLRMVVENARKGSDLLTAIRALHRLAKRETIREEPFPAIKKIVSLSESKPSVGSVKLMEDINPRKLFDEIETLAVSLKMKLAANSGTQKLVRFEEYLRLLEAGLRVALSRNEAKLFEKWAGEFKAQPTGAFLEKQNARLRLKRNKNISADLASLDIFAEKINTFYSTAASRERLFIKNLRKEMAVRLERKAVLVTGGFHKEGVIEKLRDADISYVVINPRITKNSVQENYLDFMLKQSSLLQLPHVSTIAPFVPLARSTVPASSYLVTSVVAEQFKMLNSDPAAYGFGSAEEATTNWKRNVVHTRDQFWSDSGIRWALETWSKRTAAGRKGFARGPDKLIEGLKQFAFPLPQALSSRKGFGAIHSLQIPAIREYRGVDSSPLLPGGTRKIDLIELLLDMDDEHTEYFVQEELGGWIMAAPREFSIVLVHDPKISASVIPLALVERHSPTDSGSYSLFSANGLEALYFLSYFEVRKKAPDPGVSLAEPSSSEAPKHLFLESRQREIHFQFTHESIIRLYHQLFVENRKALNFALESGEIQIDLETGWDAGSYKTRIFEENFHYASMALAQLEKPFRFYPNPSRYPKLYEAHEIKSRDEQSGRPDEWLIRHARWFNGEINRLALYSHDTKAFETFSYGLSVTVPSGFLAKQMYRRKYGDNPLLTDVNQDIGFQKYHYNSRIARRLTFWAGVAFLAVFPVFMLEVIGIGIFLMTVYYLLNHLKEPGHILGPRLLPATIEGLVQMAEERGLLSPNNKLRFLSGDIPEFPAVGAQSPTWAEPGTGFGSAAVEKNPADEAAGRPTPDNADLKIIKQSVNPTEIRRAISRMAENRRHARVELAEILSRRMREGGQLLRHPERLLGKLSPIQLWSLFLGLGLITLIMPFAASALTSWVLLPAISYPAIPGYGISMTTGLTVLWAMFTVWDGPKRLALWSKLSGDWDMFLERLQNIVEEQFQNPNQPLYLDKTEELHEKAFNAKMNFWREIYARAFPIVIIGIVIATHMPPAFLSVGSSPPRLLVFLGASALMLTPLKFMLSSIHKKFLLMQDAEYEYISGLSAGSIPTQEDDVGSPPTGFGAESEIRQPPPLEISDLKIVRQHYESMSDQELLNWWETGFTDRASAPLLPKRFLRGRIIPVGPAEQRNIAAYAGKRFRIARRDGTATFFSVTYDDPNQGMVLALYRKSDPNERKYTLERTFQRMPGTTAPVEIDLAVEDISDLYKGRMDLLPVEDRYFQTRIIAQTRIAKPTGTPFSQYFLRVKVSKPTEPLKFVQIAVTEQNARKLSDINEPLAVTVEKDPDHGPVVNVYALRDYNLGMEARWGKEISSLLFSPEMATPRTVDLNSRSLQRALTSSDTLRAGRYLQKTVTRVNMDGTAEVPFYFTAFKNKKLFERKLTITIPAQVTATHSLKVGDTVFLRVEEDENQGGFVALYDSAKNMAAGPSKALTQYKFSPYRNPASGSNLPQGRVEVFNPGLLDVLAARNVTKRKDFEPGRGLKKKLSNVWVRPDGYYRLTVEGFTGAFQQVVIDIPPEKYAKLKTIAEKKPQAEFELVIGQDPDYGAYLHVSFAEELIGNYWAYGNPPSLKPVRFSLMRFVDWLHRRNNIHDEPISLEDVKYEMRKKVSERGVMGIAYDRRTLKLKNKNLIGIRPLLSGGWDIVHGEVFDIFDADKPMEDQIPLATYKRHEAKPALILLTEPTDALVERLVRERMEPQKRVFERKGVKVEELVARTKRRMFQQALRVEGEPIGLQAVEHIAVSVVRKALEQAIMGDTPRSGFGAEANAETEIRKRLGVIAKDIAFFRHFSNGPKAHPIPAELRNIIQVFDSGILAKSDVINSIYIQQFDAMISELMPDGIPTGAQEIEFEFTREEIKYARRLLYNLVLLERLRTLKEGKWPTKVDRLELDAQWHEQKSALQQIWHWPPRALRGASVPLTQLIDFIDANLWQDGQELALLDKTNNLRAFRNLSLWIAFLELIDDPESLHRKWFNENVGSPAEGSGFGAAAMPDRKPKYWGMRWDDVVKGAEALLARYEALRDGKWSEDDKNLSGISPAKEMLGMRKVLTGQASGIAVLGTHLPGDFPVRIAYVLNHLRGERLLEVYMHEKLHHAQADEFFMGLPHTDSIFLKLLTEGSNQFMTRHTIQKHRNLLKRRLQLQYLGDTVYLHRYLDDPDFMKKSDFYPFEYSLFQKWAQAAGAEAVERFHKTADFRHLAGSDASAIERWFTLDVLIRWLRNELFHFDQRRDSRRTPSLLKTLEHPSTFEQDDETLSTWRGQLELLRSVNTLSDLFAFLHDDENAPPALTRIPKKGDELTIISVVDRIPELPPIDGVVKVTEQFRKRAGAEPEEYDRVIDILKSHKSLVYEILFGDYNRAFGKIKKKIRAELNLLADPSLHLRKSMDRTAASAKKQSGFGAEGFAAPTEFVLKHFHGQFSAAEAAEGRMQMRSLLPAEIKPDISSRFIWEDWIGFARSGRIWTKGLSSCVACALVGIGNQWAALLHVTLGITAGDGVEHYKTKLLSFFEELERVLRIRINPRQIHGTIAVPFAFPVKWGAPTKNHFEDLAAFSERNANALEATLGKAGITQIVRDYNPAWSSNPLSFDVDNRNLSAHENFDTGPVLRQISVTKKNSGFGIERKETPEVIQAAVRHLLHKKNEAIAEFLRLDETLDIRTLVFSEAGQAKGFIEAMKNEGFARRFSGIREIIFAWDQNASKTNKIALKRQLEDVLPSAHIFTDDPALHLNRLTLESAALLVGEVTPIIYTETPPVVLDNIPKGLMQTVNAIVRSLELQQEITALYRQAA